MISPDLLVCFTAPPKLNHMTGACRAANAISADLRVPLLFNGYRAIPGTCIRTLKADKHPRSLATQINPPDIRETRKIGSVHNVVAVRRPTRANRFHSMVRQSLAFAKQEIAVVYLHPSTRFSYVNDLSGEETLHATGFANRQIDGFENRIAWRLSLYLSIVLQMFGNP